MTIDEMIEVLQAYKDGKVIQAKSKRNLSSGWIYTNRMPEWNFEHLDYRAKPEPREFWLCRDDKGNGKYSVLNCKPDFHWDEVIKVTEVLDED